MEVLDVIKVIGPLLAIFGVLKVFADVLNARSEWLTRTDTANK